MRLGLHTFSYHYAAGLWEYTPTQNEPMAAVHFLRKAAELGLDGVFFADPRHFDSLEYGPAAALRERAEALGLYLELGMSGSEPDALQEMVRLAHVLGAPLVRVSIDRPRLRSQEAMKGVLAAVAAQLGEARPLCERYGISVAVENTPNVTTDDLLALLDLTGGEWVRVCFDTANPLLVLEDPLAAAEALAPFVVSAHVKDLQMTADVDGFTLTSCPLGEGVVDLLGIVDLLAARAPKASLNVKAPVARQHVPALEDDYLSHLPRATAAALGRTLRLVRDRGVARTPPAARERGAAEDEVLAEEDELVVRSVRWAQRALGRPEAEDLTPGE